MTELRRLVVEPLGRRHDRASFSCGLPELDRYLARQAGQDIRRRIARREAPMRLFLPLGNTTLTQTR